MQQSNKALILKNCSSQLKCISHRCCKKLQFVEMFCVFYAAKIFVEFLLDVMASRGKNCHKNSIEFFFSLVHFKYLENKMCAQKMNNMFLVMYTKKLNVTEVKNLTERLSWVDFLFIWGFGENTVVHISQICKRVREGQFLWFSFSKKTTCFHEKIVCMFNFRISNWN